jgi:hypothetical protein
MISKIYGKRTTKKAGFSRMTPDCAQPCKMERIKKRGYFKPLGRTLGDKILVRRACGV